MNIQDKKDTMSATQTEDVEDAQYGNVRPNTIEDFIGQIKLIENLCTYIQSAKIRKTTMDHTILYGPPGLGKTTIANIIAYEMGANITTTSGPIISKIGDLASILTNLKEGNILFIDEIHRIPKAVEEMLYSAMEDFRLDIIVGEGPAAKSVKISLPKFTIVGATTRLGLLSNPFISRFGILLSLDFYEIEELTKIVQRFANKMKISITQEAAKMIAYISRRTPRITLRITRRILDFATVLGIKMIDGDIVQNAATKMQIDKYGLNKEDIAYLQFISEKYAGGPVGIETISIALSEDRRSIEEVIEPFLIKEGFIMKTPRGRILTERSIQHLESKTTSHNPINSIVRR